MKIARFSFTCLLFCALWSSHYCSLNCCNFIQQNPVEDELADEPIDDRLPKEFTRAAVRDAFSQASRNIDCRRSVARSRTRVVTPRPVSASTSVHRFFFAITPRSLRLVSAYEPFEEATTVLRTRLNLSPEQIIIAKESANLSQILDGEDPSFQQCQNTNTAPPCDISSPYRTIDGSCNNLRNPTWGMTSTCFERLLLQSYTDGVKDLRLSISGSPLPNARRISVNIHSQLGSIPTEFITHMFMQWGQFLDHDISQSPLYSNSENQQPQCCPENPNNDDECLPILVEEDDNFFSSVGIQCLENVRTARCGSCSFGPREQINQLTAYIDASQVYGNSVNESDRLRTLDGTGRLQFQTNPVAGELPPESDIPQNDECSFRHPTLNCFLTADVRANQHPGLTSMHMLFLREHNRLAQRLRQMNPTWDGETIFQEARRIVGAQMQIITYNEFVPLIIGPERMKLYDLYTGDDGYTHYNNEISATLVNEFSTAAFRFGHSLVHSFFAELSSDPRQDSGYYLRDIFVQPFGLYSGQMERVLRGLVDSPSEVFDRHVVIDVRNHLYQVPENRSGLDLASLNILRGRDHGIPGYTAYLEYCTGLKVTSFSQLDPLFRREARPLFENVYEYVEDIDLFTGGLAERPLKGAVVGPTFACIMAKQFHRLKFGDRFYFEHGGQQGSFTPDQLHELRKNSLAKIICDNTEITEIQPYVMYFANNRNPVLDCSHLSEMDVHAWIR